MDILNKTRAIIADAINPKNSRQTTIIGWIAVIAAAISLNPALVEFLPDSIEKYIIGISGLVAFITTGSFVTSVKNKNVTGGNVAATLEAEERVKKNESI